jgi:lipoate-protein ligase A
VIFKDIEVWFDPAARPGPEAMAVDEYLLTTRSMPLLRVYKWEGAWGSLGYFGRLADAERGLPDVKWVRRWTGGGVVDHRDDWTYSLIVPKGLSSAGMRGGESYRTIHEILARVLLAEGITTGLSREKGKSGGLCFENPVEFDLMGGEGKKIAGAAQRRCVAGLLHQGSVSSAVDSRLRGNLFAESLAESWAETDIFPDEDAVAELVADRYGSSKWLARR